LTGREFVKAGQPLFSIDARKLRTHEFGRTRYAPRVFHHFDKRDSGIPGIALPALS